MPKRNVLTCSSWNQCFYSFSNRTISVTRKFPRLAIFPLLKSQKMFFSSCKSRNIAETRHVYNITHASAPESDVALFIVIERPKLIIIVQISRRNELKIETPFRISSDHLYRRERHWHGNCLRLRKLHDSFFGNSDVPLDGKRNRNNVSGSRIYDLIFTCRRLNEKFYRLIITTARRSGSIVHRNISVLRSFRKKPRRIEIFFRNRVRFQIDLQQPPCLIYCIPQARHIIRKRRILEQRNRIRNYLFSRRIL